MTTPVVTLAPVTALTIITQAAKDAGILGLGQTLSGEDTNDCLLRLNWMVDQWQRRRWLVYHLIDLAVVSTGALSYSVGLGGAFNINPRPERIEAAYFRQTVPTAPNLIDYYLEVLEAREDYARISLKTLSTFPSYAFYDPDMPLGALFVWPVPQAGIYELHILIKEILPQFTTPASVVVLPGEYFAALHFNLALRLRAAYQVEPPQPDYLPSLAKEALSTIRGANSQVPRLRMPPGLVKPGNYNIFSDQVR